LSDYYEDEFESQVSIQDYIRILYRGRWIIVISFIVVMLITLYYTYTATPVYEAMTTVIIKSDGSMERQIFNMNAFGGQTTLITNQMEILKSRRIAQRVVKRLEMSEVRDSLSLFQPNDDGEFLSMRAMVATIRGNMEVSQRKDTDIIELKYHASRPFEAAFIANTIADEFRLTNAEASKIEMVDLKSFLETQLHKKGEELRLSEEKYQDYLEMNKVASLDDETKELVTRLSAIEAQLEQTRIELQAGIEMRNSLEKQLNDRKITLAKDLSEISTPYLQSLQQELASAVAEKAKYSTLLETETTNKRFFEARINQYDEKIKAIKDRLKDEASKISTSSMVQDPFSLSQELVTRLLTVDSEIKSNMAKINALEEVVAEYNTKLETLPEKTLELARIKRRVTVDEQTYLLIQEKLEETKIQEAAKSRNVLILDEAIEPYSPIKPKKKLNIMLGILIGLGLGVGITFVIEYMDNTIKTQEELQNMGYNVLVSVPKIEIDKYEKRLEHKLEKLGSVEGKRIEARLITHIDPKSPVAETYRTLRTNLQYSQIERELKVLLMTSSGPKEGKSTTVANLAIAMAKAGKKVILLDADLRRPVIHSVFGNDKEDGITNYLMGKISYENLPKRTFLDNLWIVTSGSLPPNPSELLASKKMIDLLARLKEDYDRVLIDSPPVIAVTDAAVLSNEVDGTILIVAAGQTNKDALVRAKGLLDNINANLLGLVLNGIDISGVYGSYYYYYHHYYAKPGTKKKSLFSRIFSV
jgi:tyrosine-protein kinase Etk/Wzc